MEYKALFIDCETTGLCDIRTPYNEETLKNVWPYLTEIAYVIASVDEKTLEVTNEVEAKWFIKPEYPEEMYDIEAQKVTGLTYSYLTTFGRPAKEALEQFCVALNMVDFAVSHNTSFDMKMIKADFMRHGIDQHMRVCPWLDTVYYGREYLKKRGFPARFPKLGALYEKIYDSTPSEQLHDAFNDVAVLQKVFTGLVREKVLTPGRISLRIAEHISSADTFK